MENNNQKIIFDIPGEITSAQIISDIFGNNGIKDWHEDFVRSPENSKLLFFINITKDFFEKKLSEDDFISTLQNRFKIAKESALGMMGDVKKNLLPYAKKITTGEKIQEEEIIVPTRRKSIAKSAETSRKEVANFSKKTDNYREPI